MPGSVATFATCSTEWSSMAASNRCSDANTRPGTRMPGTAPTEISHVYGPILSVRGLAFTLLIRASIPPTLGRHLCLCAGFPRLEHGQVPDRDDADDPILGVLVHIGGDRSRRHVIGDGRGFRVRSIRHGAHGI